jgi:fused signal recognition particle receptor
MPFWRRRSEPEPDTARPAAPGTVDPAAVEPGWEPDPADFEAGPDAESETRLEPDLEPVVEPATDRGPAEIALEPAPAEDRVTPADDAQLDADVEPDVVPPAPAAWSASSMAPAPARTQALDAGLERTRGGFMARLRGALGEGTAEGTSWDDVEETLIAGDVGAALAMQVVERARDRRHPDGAEAAVREQLAGLLVGRDVDWHPAPGVEGGPAIVLVVGVNGTGKTTTIGKLASRYAGEGRIVILAAADTFRAAAIDQLRIWAERAAVPVVAHAPGADPGAVVYDALDAAVARGADMVIADTAGRLHTKSNLMDELTKIRRIVDKRLPGAVPETLFVLDATTGQNGLAQARAFHAAVGLTGIVLTKLDSTSKGGIVFAIEEALGVPVRFVGVGEQVGDLIPFDPDAFVEALFA